MTELLFSRKKIPSKSIWKGHFNDGNASNYFSSCLLFVTPTLHKSLILMCQQNRFSIVQHILGILFLLLHHQSAQFLVLKKKIILPWIYLTYRNIYEYMGRQPFDKIKSTFQKDWRNGTERNGTEWNWSGEKGVKMK